jgi:hypothetical protein
MIKLQSQPIFVKGQLPPVRPKSSRLKKILPVSWMFIPPILSVPGILYIGIKEGFEWYWIAVGIILLIVPYALGIWMAIKEQLIKLPNEDQPER